MNAPVADTQFADPSLGAAEQQANASMEKKSDPATEALIKRFERENKFPNEIRDVIAEMDKHRKYVHTEANMPTVKGGVATNYLYKHQLTHKAQVNAREPTVNVRPKKKIGQVVPELQAMLDGYADTMGALIQHFMSPDEMGLKAVLDGAIQDVDTVGIVFLKLDWLEDINRDPAGAQRPQDFQSTVMALQNLVSQFSNGDFTEDDDKYRKMAALSETVKSQMEAEVWRQMQAQAGAQFPDSEDPRKMRWDGVPSEPQISELPKYRGFLLSSIMPEDARWDWTIFQPENFARGGRFSYKTYMDEDDIRSFFQIPADQPIVTAKSSPSAPKSSDGDSTSIDSADRSDIDSVGKNTDMHTVWTRMDRRLNKIYSWIEGSDCFLRDVTPELVTTNWFNVFPFYYNRTSGRFLPVSYVTLGKPLQEEINLVRTHKRQGKRAAYARWIAEAGLFDDEELDQIENCAPNAIHMTNKKVEDIKKKMMEMPGKYDPAVHEIIDERQELGVMVGQSAASQGVTRGGSDSATEAAIANQTADVVLEDHKNVNEALIRNIAQSMAETLNQALPEENAKAIVGPGGVFPMIDREQLWMHLQIEIEAGSTGRPQQDKALDQLRTVVEIGKEAGLGMDPFGPKLNPITVMEKAAKAIDWRVDPKTLIIFPALPPMPPMPPPMPGSPAESNGGGPGGPPQVSGGPGALPTGPEGQPAPKAPSLPMVQGAPQPPAMAQAG